MYGKGAGTLSAATGISLLPNTGDSHTLFIVAAGLLVGGVVVFVISLVLARKSRHTEAK
ncbi:MAG: LPXTG cell wall anchor domain-containing protein [Candidatus Saccharimonadales bacterium]|jgi:LPXTG-motif cell wall-anchored protein